MDFFASLTALDLSVLDFIRNTLQSVFGDIVMIIVTGTGEWGAIWLAAALICLCFPKTRRAGIAVIVAVILGAVTGELLLKNIIARPRPFQVNEAIQLIIPPPSGYSMPSGHTCSSFAAATVLAYFIPKLSFPVYAYASLIAFSRMYLYVHYPSDVICGGLLGAACAFAAIMAVKYVYERFGKNNSDNPQQKKGTF